MMENGLSEFYKSQYSFCKEVDLNYPSGPEYGKYNHRDDDDDDLHALTMDQMIRPLYIVIGLLITSILVFFSEIIFFKWETRRHRNHLIFQFISYFEIHLNFCNLNIFRKNHTGFTSRNPR